MGRGHPPPSITHTGKPEVPGIDRAEPRPRTYHHMKFPFSILIFCSAALAHAGNGDHMSPLSSAKGGPGLDSWNGARPDGHAPIGVMGEHTHAAGEFMISYRYMFMAMQRNYKGDSEVSDARVLQDFIVTPTDMDMEMHMLGLMYAPTDRLTFMGMLNLVQLSMNHRVGRGPLVGTPSETFRTESGGLGDSSITAMYRFWDGPGQRAHIGLGLLLPTAETDEEDFLPPAGRKARLPYPMQLGSGSWGLAPSITYLGQNDDWSWGGQLSGRIHLDDNDEGYRLGDRGEATVWGARRVNEMLSASLRATASSWGNVRGQDDEIPVTNPMGVPIVPTADPDRRGGTRIDLSAGINFYESGSGVRLAAEAGIPLWQRLDGPQLGTDWWTIVGFQWAW